MASRMNLGAQLINEIRHRPDDTVQPLILADYLERMGDTRAAYLRWMHAANDEPADTPERAHALGTAQSLMAENELEWARPLAGRAMWWQWSKSGIDSVELGASASILASELLERHPVREFLLSDLQGGLPADWPLWTSDIFQFRLRLGPVGDLGLAKILASGQWQHLEELEASGTGAGLATTSELIRSGMFGSLKSLHLADSPSWGDKGLAQLSDRDAPKLKCLDLNRTNITAGGITTFLSGDSFPSLEILRLATLAPPSRFIAAGMASMAAALLDSPCLPRLTSLDLSGWRLGPDAWSDFARSHRVDNLAELSLARCALGSDGIAILREGHALAGTSQLDISSNGLAPSAMSLLAQSPLTSRLNNINIAHNQILDKGVMALIDSPLGERSMHYDIRDNGIGRPGLMALASLPEGRIHGLRLGGNQVNGTALKHLLASKATVQIRNLDIADIPAEVDVVDALAKADPLVNLQTLRIDTNLLRVFLARKRLWVPPTVRWLIRGETDHSLARALFALGARDVWFESPVGMRRLHHLGAVSKSAP